MTQSPPGVSRKSPIFVACWARKSKTSKGWKNRLRKKPNPFVQRLVTPKISLCLDVWRPAHAVEPQDVDWFTAVDDLTQDAGETGAGHLDTQQFSSGVFYRYASVNLKQLQVNLGLLPDMKSAETADTRKAALDIARHVFHMLATVVPSAKQQSFAAHNLADFAVVSFADQPISLANAFEEPVKRDRNGGFLKPSVTTLADYWARINKAYGLQENARAFSVQPGVELNGRAADSLAALEAWISKDGQD